MKSQHLNLEVSELDRLDLVNERSWGWLEVFYEKNIESELEAFMKLGHNPYQGSQILAGKKAP